MDNKLSSKEQDQLTEFAHKLQLARGKDLEEHANSITEDTYRLTNDTFNNIFYWPDGHDGPVKEVPYLKHLSPTEQALIEQINNTTQYTYLAHGVGRITFTIDTNPDYIIKIGRWGLEIIMGNGTLVNQSEHEFYEKTNKHLNDSPLLPITLHADDYSWVIQRKVTTYENYTGNDKPNFEELLEEINNRLGPYAPLVTDKTQNNIGIVDGDWYLFDYGHRV